jgi:hypothetical protein
MRSRIAMIALGCFLMVAVGNAFAGDSEQDIVNKYLQKAEKKTQPKKEARVGWFNVGAQYNRINRSSTDYVKFDNALNTEMSGGSFNGLYNAKSINADLGTMVTRHLGLSVGGEYWLKNSETISGTVQYSPGGGAPISLVNPTSEIKVMGGFAQAQYYLLNPPSTSKQNHGVSAWLGGTAGYYGVSWSVFQAYQNLNLSTATPDPGGTNATFKGTAPGFSINMGIEYPIISGLTMSADANYLYLNFTNVAWYNSSNQEVVASYDGTKDGRVDLNFNGLRGKFAIRKYFKW